MPLRGIKPEKIEKRLKALFYGAAGVGKTMASIQFPAPYLIDTERGCENDQYVKMLSDKGGAIFQSDDIDEIITEVKSLITEKHAFKTLIIDPLTTVYQRVVDEEALKPSSDGKDPTAFGRHYVAANRKIKHLLTLCNRLDMNVIFTSHQKSVYGEKLQVLEQTFDCYKKMDYPFDLLIEVQKRGGERIGVVKKSRIKTFPDADNFPFSYDEIAKRYGKEVLEKSAEAKELATKENIEEVTRLIDLLKVPETIVSKWLKKSNSESLEEMESDQIAACINSLKEKLTLSEKKT